jgi:signal transduction histidine kinase/ligand-binding sensor domain-containing protein
VVLGSPAAALDPSREPRLYGRAAWTVDDGLPHATVRALAQSADGYLWVGTYEGLVRFDGVELRLFDRNSTPGLPNNSVLVVAPTRDGALWVGTNAGVSRLAGGTVRHFGPADGVPAAVYALVEEPDGTLWAATSGGGLARWQAGRWRVFGRADGLPHEMLTALTLAPDGTLWIGTVAGLAVRRGGRIQPIAGMGEAVQSLVLGGDALWVGTVNGLRRLRDGAREEVPVLLPLEHHSVTTLGLDRDGAVWIGTYDNGLYRFTGGRLDSFGIDDGLLDRSVRALLEDADGDLWVGTNGGLQRLSAGRFVTYGRSDGLADGYVRSVLEDESGALWAGTAGGLTRLLPGPPRTLTSADGLASDYVVSLARARGGGLWVGTTGGLHRVLPLTGNGARFRVERIDLGGDVVIRAVLEDRGGTLWVGTDNGLLALRDGRRDRIGFLEGLRSEFVMAMAEGPDGVLWVATDGGGLARIRHGSVRSFTVADGLSSDHLMSLLMDADGSLWIGTDGEGLDRFELPPGAETARVSVFRSAQGLPVDKAVQILDDGRGRLWLGSNHGLASVPKEQLLALAAGRRQRIEGELFGRGDGMASSQCNGAAQPPAIRARDGRLWFATAAGLAVTEAAAARGPMPAPRVMLGSALADGHPLPLDAPIDLPTGVRRLELSYGAIALRAPEQVRYRYRLEGFDPGWVDGGRVRTAVYTNLPPGGFRFRVAASLDGSRWREAAPALALRLVPRPWQRRWFLPLVLLLAAAALATGHRLRLRALHRRAEELEETVAARTRSLVAEQQRTEEALHAAERAREEGERHERLLEEAVVAADAANRAKSTFLATTSHELRTPLNSIIGFSQLVLGREEEVSGRSRRFLENILTSGQHLLSVINDILDLSKIEAGRMELFPELVSPRHLAQGVVEVLKGVSQPRRVAVALDVPTTLPLVEADPVRLKQVLYNLLSNAVKFSPKGGSIELVARTVAAAESPLARDSLSLRIVDHGIGIAPEEREVIFQEFKQGTASDGERPEGTGLGLALVRRFVQLHGGCVEVTATPGGGATFAVTLPLRQPGVPAVDGEATARTA